MATFWFKVHQCIDDVNKVLQYADISIADELEHLLSLQNEIQNLRDSWETVLQEAKLVSSLLGQSTTLKENRSHTIVAEENFKISIYYKALDSLLVQLSERFKVVDVLNLFLKGMPKRLNNLNINNSTTNICSKLRDMFL